MLEFKAGRERLLPYIGLVALLLFFPSTARAGQDRGWDFDLERASISEEAYAYASSKLAPGIDQCGLEPTNDCYKQIAAAVGAQDPYESWAFARRRWGAADARTAMTALGSPPARNPSHLRDMLEIIEVQKGPTSLEFGRGLLLAAAKSMRGDSAWLSVGNGLLCNDTCAAADITERAAEYWSERAKSERATAALANTYAGQSNLAKTDFTKARRYFEQASELDDGSHLAVGERASIFSYLIQVQMGLGDLKAALQTVARAKEKLPAQISPASAYYLVSIREAECDILLRLEQAADAERCASRLVADGRRNGFLQRQDVTLLARSIEAQGRRAEAVVLVESFFDELNSSGPAQVPSREVIPIDATDERKSKGDLAWLLYRAGKRDGARAALAGLDIQLGFLPYDFARTLETLLLRSKLDREEKIGDRTGELETILEHVELTKYSNSAEAAAILEELGLWRLQQGRTKDAVDLLQKVHRAWAGIYPASHQRSISGQSGLAAALFADRQELGRALDLYRSAGRGVLTRAQRSNGFDRLAQEAMVEYRRVFTEQVKLAWFLGATDSSLK